MPPDAANTRGIGNCDQCGIEILPADKSLPTELTESYRAFAKLISRSSEVSSAIVKTLPKPLQSLPRSTLVAVHVSSMKTRRSGSRSSWPSNQARRRLRTSGQSCSIACPVPSTSLRRAFFACDPATIEEPPQGADPANPAITLWPSALASCPASRMNQIFNPAGIPRDSAAVENALTVVTARLAKSRANPKARSKQN